MTSSTSLDIYSVNPAVVIPMNLFIVNQLSIRGRAPRKELFMFIHFKMYFSIFVYFIFIFVPVVNR